MSKAGRKPSRTKESEKWIFYFFYFWISTELKPIRLMRSSKFEIDIAEKISKTGTINI